MNAVNVFNEAPISFEIHTFVTRDQKKLSFKRSYRVDRGGSGEPVLLAHGAGVRSNIFHPPGQVSIVDLLAKAGYDVWNVDWRASINHAPNEWTLDRAAVYDFPAAVAKIREVTGAKTLSAIVHCQGSTSFMISLVAGLLPEIKLAISNAVSLHPVVPPRARWKGTWAVRQLGRYLPYLNPQWGISAPRGAPAIFDSYVRAIHHECNNPVCKWSSFTYGSGFPTLWRHENLSASTHDWLAGEFAHVPMTFFRQMADSIDAGYLVSTGEFSELPPSVVANAPKTDARIVLVAGALNDCFTPEAQMRSFDFIERHAPGRHTLHVLAGYGHLDVFLGKNAARDCYPIFLDELRKG
ncbi:MAG: alpha/beta hydrolase [Methylocystis sp.]|nr:alpha/beta hydrolase [Methylocystis sp.]